MLFLCRCVCLGTVYLFHPSWKHSIRNMIIRTLQFFVLSQWRSFAGGKCLKKLCKRQQKSTTNLKYRWLLPRTHFGKLRYVHPKGTTQRFALGYRPYGRCTSQNPKVGRVKRSRKWSYFEHWYVTFLSEFCTMKFVYYPFLFLFFWINQRRKLLLESTFAVILF